MKRLIIIITCIVTAIAVYATPPKLNVESLFDGRYNDNWCMPGVYTYTCRIQCEAGLENLLKGDITLIR